MKSLEECRKEIDEIDSQIINLFEQRMEIVKSVTQYKIDNNVKVLDSSREAMMLAKNLSKIHNDEYKQYYPDVLNGFLSASKKMQSDIINKNQK